MYQLERFGDGSAAGEDHRGLRRSKGCRGINRLSSNILRYTTSREVYPCWNRGLI
jgi:hypothetical protein